MNGCLHSLDKNCTANRSCSGLRQSMLYKAPCKLNRRQFAIALANRSLAGHLLSLVSSHCSRYILMRAGSQENCLLAHMQQCLATNKVLQAAKQIIGPLHITHAMDSVGRCQGKDDGSDLLSNVQGLCSTCDQ